MFPDIEFGGFSVSKKLRFQKAKFKISWNLGWLIHAIQAVTNATSVSTSQPCRVRYFDQLPSLELIFAQSWSRVQHRSKSQDTLNIFRRTRGYPSVLRKVWPVYCSSQSWRFDCSWRKHSSIDTIQLPLVWLYQRKSFLSRFPFQEFSIWFQTSTSLRSITLRSGCWQIQSWASSACHLLHYRGKKQCKKWSNFSRKLFCVSVTVLFIWKNCTNYQIF